jgi:4-amino-4-deoxy-L-arabinose transferase-like glycosyltransferase
MSQKARVFFALAYGLHVVWVLLLASVPPVSRDALTHHLALPKLWVENGGMYEIPGIVFSYYPQLVDLLYTLPLLFGNDIAAKYLHFMFALLTALLVFLFVCRRIGPFWAALAGLMFLTIPVILKLSVTVYVDLGLIFFTTGALFAGVLWLEQPAKLRWLVLAALCSGLALSTKYNALVSFLVLSLLLPFFFLNGREDKDSEQLNAVRYGVIFVSISVLVFSPWLVRNYALTGNPLHPLMGGVFGARTAVASDAAAATNADEHLRAVLVAGAHDRPKALGPLLTRKLVYEESLGYTLMIPVRIFYEGRDDDPKYFDGRLNPLLLLLPVVLLLMARKEGLNFPEIRFFAAFAVLVVLLIFVTTDMRIRWISTIIPPVVVLTSYALFLVDGLVARKSGSRAVANGVTGLAAFLFLLPNALYALDLYGKIDPLPYVTGKQTYAEYVQAHRPEFAAIDMANDVVPEGQKVLGLYLGNRRYYFSTDATVVNKVFTSIAAESGSGRAIAERLVRLGYSHLVLRRDLFQRWLDSTDADTRARVMNFVSYRLNELVIEEGYGLYEIVDTEMAGLKGDGQGGARDQNVTPVN